MAIRKILTLGDEALTKKCRTVETIDTRILNILDDLKDTLYDSGGAGLAAPQVGILRRLVVIDVGNGLIELINPEIIASEGSQTGAEGCLSYPGKWGVVTRPNRVKVKAQNRKGQWVEYSGEGLLARAFCHELDNLDGHRFMEKVSELLEDEE